MFTGIITDVGKVLEVLDGGDLKVRIGSRYDVESITIGASICHDGICLTVTEKGIIDNQNWYSVEISAETASTTNIRTKHNGWQVNSLINLERSLKIGDELGGHIVTGHVDGLAKVISMINEGDSTRITFETNDKLAPFIASKGSVALNGTSLTVNETDGTVFGVNLIQHTKKNTTWGQTKVGDLINIEIDILARYVSRIKEMQG